MTRGWHHFEIWECVPAGMYETIAPKGHDADSAVEAYRDFLASARRFESALRRVLKEWPISCEQFLLNANINRIAWLGQSSMCIATGIPACFRAGFSRLTEPQQAAANALAARFLGQYLKTATERHHGHPGAIPRGMAARIRHYVATWTRRGYPEGIPDEVPNELMRQGLAPSYKAIALAILKNDHHLTSLGYTAPVSPWYNELKRLEINNRYSQWHVLRPRANPASPLLIRRK